MEPASKRRRLSDEQVDRDDEKPHAAKRKSRLVSRPSQLDAFSGVSVGNVYKSNLFKLKVDELLGQVARDFSQLEEPINALLRTLKESIEAIPGRDPISVSWSRRDGDC
jgi:U3 small nucleolar RNA-associated protein 22